VHIGLLSYLKALQSSNYVTSQFMMINEPGEVGRMRIASAPFCPAEISRDLTWEAGD
jgi:hypothetical protein